MSIPQLFGRECIWMHESQVRECAYCGEPIPAYFGRYLALAPTMHFCSAECVRALDNSDPTPWEVDSEDNGPRDEAHRMEMARLVK